jgi:peptidoglycan-N-acetylglucosamine deacetylase
MRRQEEARCRAPQTCRVAAPGRGTFAWVAACLFGVTAILMPAANSTPPRDVRVIWSGSPTAKRVALTFDDGPRPGVTEHVLDLLDDAGARATFFVVGQRIVSGGEKARALLRRMRDEGHEIGNHSYSHPNVARLGIAELHREIARTDEAIDAACGIRPRMFRPPGGGLDFNAVRSLASTGLEGVVLWSIDPSDWKNPSRGETWQRVATALHPGAIILLHDTHEETLRALPLLLDLIQARGFEIVTVSDLVSNP